ncbi:tetratricopeptide repeat protein [Borrelia sp. BU AG58]|uniref:tetratricopeptide repeat protein n=1 Tax=Borrelia sp. BU AG58 TaxID=2887345 RepID=UPI001E3E47C2|nr:tetratricopeptide repeat protein [Borrelia sp. BU AG58]UER67705.1 tetratricopeptide repeat protein [Borrelia sp. BU AG58]
MYKALVFLFFCLLFSCSTLAGEYQVISDEYYKLAKLNEALGNDGISVSLYEKSIKFNSSSNNASSYNFVLAYINLKKYDEAESRLESLLKSDTSNILLTNLKAYLFLRKGDLEEALKFYLNTLEVAPANKEALFNVFYIYHVRNDRENSRKYILKYRELNYPIPPNASDLVSSVLEN